MTGVGPVQHVEVGQVWEDVQTGKRYIVVGLPYNSVTDEIDVRYMPMYAARHLEYTRQMHGHTKAWFSTDENGVVRFKKISEARRPQGASPA